MVLYPIQQTTKNVIILTYTLTPLIERIRSICKKVLLRTPYWLYDMVENQMNPEFEDLYAPHVHLNLYSYCFVLYCEKHKAYYTRLIESCKGFVSQPFPHSIILAESLQIVPETIQNSFPFIVKLQWIIDCIHSQTILPFSEYKFNKYDFCFIT